MAVGSRAVAKWTGGDATPKPNLLPFPFLSVLLTSIDLDERHGDDSASLLAEVRALGGLSGEGAGEEGGDAEEAEEGAARRLCAYLEARVFRRQLWVVTEFVQAGSVLSLMSISDNKVLREPLVRSICRDTLAALRFLRDRGKVHGNIKGANLLVTQEGRVKVSDFGIAGMLGEATSTNNRSSLVGVALWMAPEVIEGGTATPVSYVEESYRPMCVCHSSSVHVRYTVATHRV